MRKGGQSSLHSVSWSINYLKYMYKGGHQSSFACWLIDLTSYLGKTLLL